MFNPDSRLFEKGYNGNPLLKKTKQQIQWTDELKQEFIKCALDPIYFAEKYIYIVHVDRGLIPIDLYDYQKEIIQKITNSRRVCVCTARQSGKCVDINTEITVRNKKTGQIKTLSIGEFYELNSKKNIQNETD